MRHLNLIGMMCEAYKIAQRLAHCIMPLRNSFPSNMILSHKDTLQRILEIYSVRTMLEIIERYFGEIRIKNGFIILQYIIIYSKEIFFQSFSYDYCYFQQVYKMLL